MNSSWLGAAANTMRAVPFCSLAGGDRTCDGLCGGSSGQGAALVDEHIQGIDRETSDRCSLGCLFMIRSRL